MFPDHDRLFELLQRIGTAGIGMLEMVHQHFGYNAEEYYTEAPKMKASVFGSPFYV